MKPRVSLFWRGAGMLASPTALAAILSADAATPALAASAPGSTQSLGWVAVACFCTVTATLALYLRQIGLVRRLGEQRRRAESADRAKTAFLANMSHEIRTPLNGVIGIAGALSRTRLTVSQREMVDLILSSGEVIERYLTDVLDLSRVEAGQLVIDAAPFELDKTVASATLLMRQRAEDKRLAFTLDIDSALSGRFVGDAVRLRQIVTNLCSNAVKFTDMGHVSVTCRAIDRADAHGRTWVRLEIADTGRGFDDAFAARLFARFQQADAEARAQGGAGLGLSICQALAEAMGGAISAASRPGAGSVFTVELPLARAPAVEAAATLSAFDRPEIPPPGSGLKILLVEDHPINRQVMSVMLEPFGTDLTTVQNGREALDVFIAQPFDLILMDQRMPVMDGLQATKAIREIEWRSGRARTPVIMLTGEAGGEFTDRTEAAGADGRLSKPVRPSELAAILEWVGANDPEIQSPPGTRRASEAI